VLTGARSASPRPQAGQHPRLAELLAADPAARNAPTGPAGADPLAPADAWLRFYERCWTERLDALGDLFQAGPEFGGEQQ
jgi:hypothetical protein